MILFLLYLTLAFWMVGFNLRPIQSLDFWWHLGSGRYIVEAGAVPFSDPFSLLCRGSPWVDSYWLFEVILYALYRAVGFPGILLAKGLLIVAALWVQDRRLKDGGIVWFWRFLVLIGIFLSAHPRGFGWSEQASLVTFFFFSVLIWMLEYFRRGGWTRIVWLGPPLFMLWANMHRGFILGGIVAACYLLGEKVTSVREIRKRILWLSLCALATLATPYGIRLYTMIYDDLSLSPAQVAGWSRPPWGHLEFFWISLILFWCAVGIQVFKSRRWPASGPLIAALFLTWSATRYVANSPYLMVFIWPFMVEVMADWPRTGWVTRFVERHAKTVQAILLAILIGASLTRPVRGGVNARIFPVGACDFIEREKIVGPFYHDYAFGGYWMWRFAGERPVFIDGRYPAVLGYQPLKAHIDAARNGPPEGWGEFLKKSGVHAVLIGYPRSPAYPSVTQAYFPKSQWGLVYWDDVAQVLVRKTVANGAVLARNEFKFIRPDTQETYWVAQLRSSGNSRRQGLQADLTRALQIHPYGARPRRFRDLFTGERGP